MFTNFQGFDIRNFTDKLTPAKGKNRYICPVCNGNNLTIEPNTGEYQCWNGCECKDIREAISPWAETISNNAYPTYPKRIAPAKPKAPTPAPIPGIRELAKLPAPVTHPEKRKRGLQTEIEYFYSDNQWVQRIEKPNPEKPKGYEKITIPYHVNSEGEVAKGKGEKHWLIYRLDEVLSHGAGKWVLDLEGETCVEAARYLGLVGFTSQGAESNEEACLRAILQTKQADVAGVVCWPDHDDTGYKKAKKMAEAARQAQVPFVQINPLEIWPECPDKGDIADWVKWGMEQGWRKEEFVERLERAFNAAAAARHEELIATTPIPSISIVDAFKNDLLAIANLDDPIIRLLKTNEVASTYRMPVAEIRKAITNLENRIRTPKAQFLGVDELLTLETEGIDYLIPGLLPRGETVLCVALPKAGKTLLSIDAAFAVATGESKFLGESVQQGKVLLVSVDESIQSTKLKLIKRGFRASDANNMAIMTQWDVSQMGELEARLEDYRPDLVVIDSLKRITAGRELSENSAEFADIIYQLKELLGRYGAAGILIHHANKNNEAVGVAKVRGSTAITGACWGIWQLDHIIQTTDEKGKPIKGKPKYDPTDPRRIFTAICRDADNQTKTIQFNPENHSFTVADEDIEAQTERKTQEQRIIDLLSQYHPKGLTGREITDALGLGRSVYTVLDRMVGRRTVTHRQSKTDRRSMVYALPKTGDTHPPLPSVKMLTNFSESIDIQGIDNSQQLVNKSEEFSQQILAETPSTLHIEDSVEYSNPLPDNELEEVSQQLLDVGGGVCVESDDLTEKNISQLAQSPSTPKSPVQNPPTQVGQVGQVDFSSFPYEGKENQYSDGIKQSIAFGIKVKFEQCQTKDDFAVLRGCGEYSREQLNWVRKNLISPEEQERFKRIVTS